MDRIGKYDFIRELGAGATSKVLLALDSSSNQQVALKVIELSAIRDQSSARAFKKLLQTEASLVGKLRHPNIVQMLDAVVSDELSYIALEYVSGGSLEQYAEPGQLLPFHQVAELMYKCCKALEYAQSRGVIHRDIKPANILLQDDFDVKITDFGAAMVEDGASTVVIGVGSLSYMSPEQITSEELTHQTDIYSLGMTMYKLLTGRLPIHATSRHGMIYQIVSGELPSPMTIRTDVPEALDAIVQRATHKDLAQRYQTWAEFSRDLEAFINPASQNHAGQGGDVTGKVAALRGLPFFEKFNDAELREALQFCKWHKISNGTTLLREGDEDNTFFIMVEGMVKATKSGRTVAILQKGDCFGEVRRLPNSPYRRNTGIEAGSDCILFEVDLAVLSHASLECRYQFSESFMFILLRRLESANTRISQLLGAQR